MRNRKDNNIKKKTEEMVQEGIIQTGDFNEIDQWDQSDPVNRQLTEKETEQLREQARKQVKEHNSKRQQKKPT